MSTVTCPECDAEITLEAGTEVWRDHRLFGLRRGSGSHGARACRGAARAHGTGRLGRVGDGP